MNNENQFDIAPDLLEYLVTKQCLQEPFAQALTCILVEKGICTNTEVMDMLDKIIRGDLKRGSSYWYEAKDDIDNLN